MATLPVNLETLSLDEIRKLAEEEAKKATTAVVTPPAVTEEEEEEDEGPAESFVAERSIDLGEGSGVQVFKGEGVSREEALEDLSNKLADAQRHATKKIRELSKLKAPEQPTINKEEESLLAAEMVSTPSEVVKKILKKEGIDLDKLKKVTAKVERDTANESKKVIADEFVSKHPDFLDNDRNAQRLSKAVSLFGEFSLENLEKAYQDLSDSGLLEVKGEEAGDGQGKGKQPTRIEVTADNNPPHRTKRASGISTHRRSALPAPTEPTEDDLYSMPLEELRKRANKQLAG